MNFEEALEKLGLDPVDTQLRAAHGTDGRQGGTTWMLVEAAVALMNGRKVVLVGRTLQFTQDVLLRTTLSYISKLGAHVTGRDRDRVAVSTGGILFWISQQTSHRFWVGNHPEDFAVFSDGEWQLKALTRSQGPFALVRHITAIDADLDQYAAYDEEDVFLFDLPGKTVDKLLKQDPYRIRYTGPPR